MRRLGCSFVCVCVIDDDGGGAEVERRRRTTTTTHSAMTQGFDS